jgi:hypothetical protein
MGGHTSLLLCVHPAITQAASTHQTLQFGQLSVPTVTRVQAQSTVDYGALAAQLSNDHAAQTLDAQQLVSMQPCDCTRRAG